MSDTQRDPDQPTPVTGGSTAGGRDRPADGGADAGGSTAAPRADGPPPVEEPGAGPQDAVRPDTAPPRAEPETEQEVGPNGAGSNGSGPKGAGSNGSGPKGSGSNGSGSNGAGQNGAQNGDGQAARNGAAPGAVEQHAVDPPTLVDARPVAEQHASEPPTLVDARAAAEPPTIRTTFPVGARSHSGSASVASEPGLRPVSAGSWSPSPATGASSPPPWSRVPGEETPPPSSSSPIPDGPTAFLAVPGRPVPTDETVGESGSWAAVRAVRNRPPRQAALQLRRLDPWSVLKLALVLAVVLFFVWLVAVGVLYGVLDGVGVWDRLNGTYADLVSGEADAGAAPLISAGSVLGFAALIGAVNSLLFAVAATIAAFVYNVSADLVGGVEVTLSERD